MPLLEEGNQTPTTPLRGIKIPNSEYNGAGYTGQYSNPMLWPLPTSPGPSFGTGLLRTPVHGFGNAAISDARLSMGQFEFGADGELVLYSAGGRAIPMSSEKAGKHPECAPVNNAKGALEPGKMKVGLQDVELATLENKMHVASKQITAASGIPPPSLHLDNLESITPLNALYPLPVRRTHLNKHEGDARQKTLTEGGRCRSKSVHQNVTPLYSSALPISGVTSDLLGATPEVRNRKIKSLYAELQRIQEVLCQLQTSIRFRDAQIASKTKDNTSLWSMAVHIAACIQLALEEESNVLDLQQNRRMPAATLSKTPVRQTKRRRSSLGVAGAPSAKQMKPQYQTPKVLNVNGQQLLELEELFCTPGTGELFAACDMLLSPLGTGFAPLSSKALQKTGMCPIQNHTSKFASITSPMPLGNFNAAFVDGDNAKAQAHHAGQQDDSLADMPAKENSFTFNC
jgi:hypothetical protein